MMIWQHNRTVALLVVAMAVLLVPACSKKQIETEPVVGTYDAEAERRAAEEARQREAERSGSIQEGSLEAAGGQQGPGATADAVAAARAAFENEDVRFEFDSANLNAEAQQILRQKAQWLKENPRVTVIIEGHCDTRGTNEYNLALGERRALSAQAFLVSLGIAENRLATVSYGEERPLDPSDTEAAWIVNRRAHFVIER
jgi:peptidoglycan-associated lipoprotein